MVISPKINLTGFRRVVRDWVCVGEMSPRRHATPVRSLWLQTKRLRRVRHSPNNKGTERDLVPVYGRTPRRQFAVCIGDDEKFGEHQERAPFVGIYERAEFTPAGGFVSRKFSTAPAASSYDQFAFQHHALFFESFLLMLTETQVYKHN